MKQLRHSKAGGQPQKKGSPSGKSSRTTKVQTPEDNEQIDILNPKLLAQKRPLQSLSSMEGGAAASSNNTKRPKLLPEVNSANPKSEDESDESEYEIDESDNDVSDTTGSDENDVDETGSDASESSNEDPEETAGQTFSRPDLTKELSSMSFEELLQMRNQVGAKTYQKITSKKRAPDVTRTEKRQYSSKNGPLETSAKIPVPLLRQVVPVKKKIPRDPRFDDLSGKYKPEVFEKTYSFLNELKEKEKEIVEKKLKKSQNVKEQNKLQQLLKRMTQLEDAQKKRRKERDNHLAFKRQQRELAKQGKKPFFLKKSEMQKIELAEKYKELKKSGKLESFLSKKRKRNASKDKRRLPFRKNI